MMGKLKLPVIDFKMGKKLYFQTKSCGFLRASRVAMYRKVTNM